jgi:hypothetical protein
VLDLAVRRATARGLRVALTVGGGGGPGWADGPHRPRSARSGTWRPSPREFGSFARALARRFGGNFDPGTGTLPRVRYYEAWSEPNLASHLAPQWIRQHGGWVAESPVIYRWLLNAFYAAVKSVRRSNIVIAGAMAPFGDLPGAERIPPVQFLRGLLCLRGTGLAPVSCPDPAHFDILSHHPYAIFGPTEPAFNPDDASVPDLWKLTGPLAAAVRTGRALPRAHKRLWVTEFSWDSSPPDPNGVPIRQHALWLEEAFYVLWRQGVDTIAWYNVVDQPPVPDYASTYQSGVYYRNGRRKPAFRALRFPFVAERESGGRVILWGIAPRSGAVAVKRRSGGHWRTMLTLNVRAHAIFTRVVAMSGSALMRAQLGPESSLVWRMQSRPRRKYGRRGPLRRA